MQEFPVILVQWEAPASLSTLEAVEDVPTTEQTPSPESLSANTTVERKLTPPSAEHLPSLRIVDHFHSYVRPTWRPDLSTFCTTLTGITQVSGPVSCGYQGNGHLIEGSWYSGYDR